MTFPLPGANWTYTRSFRKLATTGPAGYQLVNNSGPIISAVVPADGNLHSCLIVASLNVSSAETGGTIAVTATTPDGANPTFTLFGAGQGTGHFAPTNPQTAMQLVAPGGTITVSQFSVLTAGAAILYAEIWAN